MLLYYLSEFSHISYLSHLQHLIGSTHYRAGTITNAWLLHHHHRQHLQGDCVEPAKPDRSLIDIPKPTCTGARVRVHGC
jgi:hypothetical protein